MVPVAPVWHGAVGATSFPLHSGVGLALAHGGGLFVELALSDLGQHPGFLARPAETPERDVKRLAFFYFYSGHSFLP